AGSSLPRLILRPVERRSSEVLRLRLFCERTRWAMRDWTFVLMRPIEDLRAIVRAAASLRPRTCSPGGASGLTVSPAPTGPWLAGSGWADADEAFRPGPPSRAYTASRPRMHRKSPGAG